MVSYQNFAIKLTIILAIAVINLIEVFPAAATTQNLQLRSEQGYRVETDFSYDETKKNTGAIAAQGKKANQVNSLKVRFYDPDGKMIANYDNIIDGIIQNNYFEFNYDLNTQQLLGKVDIGGEVAGQMYLQGDVDRGLSLIMIEPSGEEKVIDQVKSRKSKVESRKSKVKSQKSKVKSQKSKVKSQKSKVKSQKSKVKSRKQSVISNQ